MGGWMEGEGGGAGANAKLMPFPDITESAEISPLPRRREVCFICPREQGGMEVEECLRVGVGVGINEGIESNSLILGSIYRCTWGSRGARGWGREFDAMQTGSKTQAATARARRHKTTTRAYG